MENGRQLPLTNSIHLHSNSDKIGNNNEIVTSALLNDADTTCHICSNQQHVDVRSTI